MPHLYGVCHSVQKLNDKQWRDFILDDREKEKLPPVYGDEVVVWGLQDRGDIFRIHRLLFRLEKVIANTPTDDTFPVLLQENISRVINEEQTVDHLVCNSWTIVKLVVSRHKRHALEHFKTLNAHGLFNCTLMKNSNSGFSDCHLLPGFFYIRFGL